MSTNGTKERSISVNSNFDDVIEAIKEYILTALKNPTSPGYKVELVPELVRILQDRLA